jgi:general stress protein 26
MMMYDKIERLKQKLERIKIGILKTSGLKLSHSFIIDTCRVDHDGYLWCSSPDRLPFRSDDGKGFAVQVKYVDKSMSLFIKISGQAVVTAKFPCEHEQQTKNIESTENNVLLKIKIDEVHYYQKKYISAYTSFLDAINYFRFNRAIINKGA